MTSLGGSLYLPTLGKTGPLSERITSYRDSVRSKYPERVISRPGLSSFRGMPRHVDSDQVTIGRSDEWYTTQCSYRKPTGYSGQPTVNSGTFLTVLSPRHRTAVETKDAQNEARQVKIASERNRLAEEHALAVAEREGEARDHEKEVAPERIIKEAAKKARIEAAFLLRYKKALKGQIKPSAWQQKLQLEMFPKKSSDDE